MWHDTRQEVTLNTAAASTSRPGTRCSPAGPRQDSSLSNNNHPMQSDSSWATEGSLYSHASDETGQEIVHSPALFDRSKVRITKRYSKRMWICS